MSDLIWKVNLVLWDLFIVIVSLNISDKYDWLQQFLKWYVQ